MPLQDIGRGPAVVLIHGFLADAQHLEPLARELASRSLRVLIPDLPGYRGTAALPEPNDLAVAEAQIEAALAGVGCAEAALVGTSLGAWRALSIALAGRFRVTHVVALGGLVSLPSEARDGWRQLAAALRSGIDLADALASQLYAASYRASHPETSAAVGRWIEATGPRVLAAEAEAIAELRDLRPRLGELGIPILARVGDVDTATPPAWSREIASLAPHCKLEIVSDAGHLLATEDCSGTAAAIEQFVLSTVAPSRVSPMRAAG